MLNMGAGVQDDGSIPDANTALAGMNLGIGGWLSEDLVLWFRGSGTSADLGSVWQTSGVGAVAVQYWPSERVNLEGGLGFGFWDIEETGEAGFGIMLGVGFPIFTSQGGGHSLQFGLEYAGAFTDPEPIHNFGLTFGWQLL